MIFFTCRLVRLVFGDSWLIAVNPDTCDNQILDSSGRKTLSNYIFQGMKPLTF